jgi:hypothetical protein
METIELGKLWYREIIEHEKLLYRVTSSNARSLGLKTKL